MLLVAGVVSVSTNSSDTVPWVQAIMTTQRCVRIIQVGMVLFPLFFARYFGVSRKATQLRYCFGLRELSLWWNSLSIASWAGYDLGEVAMGLINMAAYNCHFVHLVGVCVGEEVLPVMPDRSCYGLSDGNKLPCRIFHAVAPKTL